MPDYLRERDIQRKVVESARRNNIIARKLDFGEGWPDYMFLCRGRVMFIEFKAPKGRTTPLQRYVHQLLRNNGFTVYVIRDVHEGNLAIQELLKFPTQTIPVV